MSRMKNTRIPGRITAVAGSCLVVLVAAWLWKAGRAEADSGGYSQVSRLEIAYVPATQKAQARVTLATGQALTYEASTDRDQRALLDLAQVFSQKNTRMFVELQGDEVRSLQVSIP